jgi:hypothetical protein
MLSTHLIFLATNMTVLVLTGVGFRQAIRMVISILNNLSLKCVPAAGLHFEPLLQLCVLETGSRTFQVLRLPGVGRLYDISGANVNPLQLLFQCVMVFALGWKVLLHPQTLGTLLRDGYLYFLVRCSRFCTFHANLHMSVSIR